MVSGINFGTTGFGQGSYGNIQRLGTSDNGRVIYSVIDSFGDESGKLSVAQNDADTFEKAYNDVMDSAPKIQKYVNEHSSEREIKKRRNISRLIVGTCGLAGLAIPIAITKKANTFTLTQILSTVAGIVVGLSAGFGLSLAATTPPGTYKFAKASRTFSGLDIQSLDD